MKKQFQLYALFFTIPLLVNAVPNKKIYYGTVVYPNQVHNPPSLSLFYKGQQIDLDLDTGDVTPKKGNFEIYEEGDTKEFYILFTENLQLPDSNEISGFKTSPDHPYKLFKLNRSMNLIEQPGNDNSTTKKHLAVVESWEIAEQKQLSKSTAIPENTLIFLMNPTFIKLQSESWMADDAVFKLPKIVFDSSLDEVTLQEVGAKMLFTLIDFKMLHKKAAKAQKLVNVNHSSSNSRILSVPQPQKRYSA